MNSAKNTLLEGSLDKQLAMNDPYYLIINSKNYLDELINNKPTNLEKYLEKLQEYETQMQHLDFNHPYKGLDQVYQMIDQIRQEKSVETNKEIISDVVSGLKILKYQAKIKKISLERIKLAIRSCKIAQAYETANPIFDKTIVDHIPFGGEYAIKLEHLDAYARKAYFSILEKITKDEDHTQAIVDFTYQLADEELEETEILSIDQNIMKYLQDKYGETVDIIKVKLSGKKKGIIKDQYTRTILAITYTEKATELAKKKIKEQLTPLIDEKNLSEYDKILTKYAPDDSGEIDILALENMQEELKAKGFLNEKGEIKDKTLHGKLSKTLIATKNYAAYAQTLLAKEMYLYYLTKSKKEREKTSIFPDSKIELDQKDLEIFQPLQDESLKEYLDDWKFPFLPTAIKTLDTKLELEKKENIPSKYLAAILLINNEELTIDQVTQLLNINQDELKKYVLEVKTVKLTDKAKQEIGAQAKTKKAEEFMKALKE